MTVWWLALVTFGVAVLATTWGAVLSEVRR